MLKGKTVVLGVTGSIAAYKIANLASMLVKQHADVNVIMSHNATNFINPITFSPLYKTIIILQSFFVYIAKCFVAIHRLCTSSCIGNGLCHDIGTHWPHQIDICRHTAH